jgi:peroxiredoxin
MYRSNPGLNLLVSVFLLTALGACADESGGGTVETAQSPDATLTDSLSTDTTGQLSTDAPSEVSEDAGPTPTDLGSVPEPDLVVVPGEDSDGDGISDSDETDIVGTDPNDADSDKDGLIDGDELSFGSNPLVKDSDGDGLDDGDEWLAQTRPDLMDSDADGFSDGQEITKGTDPNDPFSWDYEGPEWPNSWARAEGAYGTGWEIGEIMPNASLRDQNDIGFELWRLYGNVILLDFSAGWCVPCKELAEGAQEHWESHREEGFMVVHVITETSIPGIPADLEMQQAWANMFDLEFPVLRDVSGDLYGRLSTQDLYTGSLPFMLVLDRDMRIQGSFGAGQETQVNAMIEGLLPTEPAPYPYAAPETSDPLDGATPDLCDVDGDGVRSFACGGEDCHDRTPLAGPDAEEQCDLIDWNCDGQLHEDATGAATMYIDEDGDGYGDADKELLSCATDLWPYSLNSEDCDDTDPALNPETVWYEDADEDGYGNPNSTKTQCEHPFGYVANDQDSDDGDDTSLGCWSQVTVGRDHSCGLKNDGSITCWGNNSDGEQLFPAGNDFVAIDSGYQHTCAQRNDGTISCWGNDNYGVTTPPADVTFLSFTCGLGACCGITTEETNNALCWGQNTDGQTEVPDGTYIDISIAGGRHACGVLESGEVVCWGKSEGFQGGASPTAVVSGTYSQIAAAHYFTCALDASGTPTCWGGDTYGQASPPGQSYTEIRGGTVHACGLNPDNTLACWGSDSLGRTDCPDGEYSQLDVNQLHSCAVGVDGLISCWGFAEEGQTTPPPCSP